jgi:hypothetical protein
MAAYCPTTCGSCGGRESLRSASRWHRYNSCGTTILANSRSCDVLNPPCTVYSTRSRLRHRFLFGQPCGRAVLRGRVREPCSTRALFDDISRPSSRSLSRSPAPCHRGRRNFFRDSGILPKSIASRGSSFNAGNSSRASLALCLSEATWWPERGFSFGWCMPSVDIDTKTRRPQQQWMRDTT